MKTISRSSTRGSTNESITARWLLARIAPPSAGTFSTPRVHGLKKSFSHGPAKTRFINQ